MKKLLLLLILITSVNLMAQTPISHLPGVSFTFSGSYYATGGESTTNFLMCDSWNSGAYGGWLQMNLGTSITLESLRFWRGMFPNGNVASELVEVSADGTNWTLIANTSGYHVSLEETKLLFDPGIPNVQYIRISQSGTPSWFSLLEIVVNEPYFADNIYTNMTPKLLDSLGNELGGTVNSFPTKILSSKADSYQWYKDGMLLAGETNQDHIATSAGSYACAVGYSTANCGFPTTSNTVPLVLLPLDLLSFSVSPQNDHALLNWNVARLFNFSHFEIQRSSDGYAFETIDHLNPDREINAYSYIDKNPPTGTLYYRLKMVDNDTQFEYSPVRTLKIKGATFKVFPNPVQETLYVQSDKDRYNYSIYDFSGNRIYQGQSFEKSNRISVVDFPKGMYFLKTDESSTEEITIKFIVQ